MLIVRVKSNEPIYIGDNIKIVINLESGRYKVGIDAPREIPIERESVREARLNRTSPDKELGVGG